ncbi:iron dependent repressor, metal binding and dimerization domain protein [Vallitalea sediminicola]
MIYRICRDESYVRMNQLANNLNVRPSSSTKIVQKLSSIGLVNYEKYGLISLTEKGEKVGEFLYHRHIVLEKFLNIIGVEDSILKDTELMEHYVRPVVLKNIEQFIKFLNSNPNILQKYYEYLRNDTQ